jgi:hypothetical protein
MYWRLFNSMQDRDSLWVQVKSKRNGQATEMEISEVNADGAKGRVRQHTKNASCESSS